MEWFAILIPIIAGIVAHCVEHRRITWWEALLPMLPVLVLVPVTRLCVETSLTTDTERHGGWCVEAVYVEDWDEWITKTCTREVGSGKNKRTETYDCSYRDYHPPYWYLKDSNGYRVSLTESQFEQIAKRFGNRRFVDMHRWYYRDDGDEYHSVYLNEPSKLQPVTTTHRYENRIQATHGVVDFPTIPESEAREKGLYDYPRLLDCLEDSPVLSTVTYSPELHNWLATYNATHGRSKQVRIWLLIFKNKPMSVAFEQESYWKGGNKNEFVVCINCDETGRYSQWCRCFCWSPDGNTSNDMAKETIEAYITMYAASNSLHGDKRNFKPDLELGKVITDTVGKHFVRKPFKEFSYLTVDTPTWGVVLIYILTILSTTCVLAAVLNNDIHSTTDLNRYFNKVFNL